ncbi:MAG: hypothetical protein FJ225_11805 [Lentisphaerae bacterium]|nr:hypothetical protein [Lentisphaerota bacterium]
MSALLYLLHGALAAAMFAIRARRGLEATLPFFAAAMLLFPREAQLPQPAVFDLTVQRTLVMALALLVFVDRRKLPPPPRRRAPLRWLIAANIVWALVANVYSVVPLISAKSVLSTVFEYYLMYLLLVRIISEPATVHRMFTAMVLAMTAAAALGAVEAYTGFSYIKCFPEQSYRFGNLVRAAMPRDLRVKSAFQHAILFGGALALAVPQALHLIASTSDARRKALLSGAVLLMLLAVYKTFSRGPWLGLAMALTALLVFYVPLRRYVLALGAAIGAALLLRPGVMRSLIGMWTATLSTETRLGRSYSYRYALVRVVMETLAGEPFRQIVGFGQNSFYHLQLQAWFFDRYYTFLSCDSAWVNFAIESGYVGLAGMALLLGAAWWMAWRAYRALPEPGRYTPLVIAVNLATYYFMMVSVAMYEWGQNTHQLWMLIAMAAAYARSMPEPGSPESEGEGRR